MNAETQLRDLEQALLGRAATLAEEHLRNARSARERILREAAEKLKLREEKETLAARQEAERVYRQRVQAAELRLQGDIDRLRWTLVESVLDQVRESLEQLAADKPAYTALIQRLLKEAAAALGPGPYVATLSARDHQRLGAEWKALAAAALPGAEVALEESDTPSLGGVRLATADGRAQVDNSFEGRLERLGDEIHRLVMERLFASVPDMESMLRG